MQLIVSGSFQMYRSACSQLLGATRIESLYQACGMNLSACTRERMLSLVCALFSLEYSTFSGHTTDKSSSFFVGDAAGRPTDFAGTDRKWALNVGIPFFTPEVSPIFCLSQSHR